MRKYITTRQVFNETHTLYKGAIVEVVREIIVEGEIVCVFREIGDDQEFRITKTSTTLKEIKDMNNTTTLKKGDTVTLVQYNNTTFVHEVVISEATVQSSGKVETMLEKHYTKLSTEWLLDTNYEDSNILGYKIASSQEDVERYIKRQNELIAITLDKYGKRLESCTGKVMKRRIEHELKRYGRSLDITDLRKNKEVA